MKGKLLVIGGAEDQSGKRDRFSDISILERFISKTRLKKRSRIEILTSASSISQSNLLEVVTGAPLSIENMTLHLMSQHDIFNLKKMQLEINNPPKAEV